MSFRHIIAAGLAAGAIALSAAAALASPAQITQNTEVRDGDNRVIGNFSAGTAVDLNMCSGQYCYVFGPGLTGWVPQGAVAATQGNPPPQQQQPQQPPPQNNQGGNQNGFGFPFSFDFNLGNPQRPNNYPPPRPNTPPRPSRDAQVCFYDLPNFRGDSFCVYGEDYEDALSRRWNDRISSISVDRGLEVTVCRDNRLRGTCAEIGRDVSRLPSSLNDRISSFEVY